MHCGNLDLFSSTAVRSFHFSPSEANFFSANVTTDYCNIGLYTVVPVGGALTSDCKPTALFVVQNRLEREAQVGLFPALPGRKRGCVEGKASTVAIMEDCQHKVAKKQKQTVLAPD